MVLAGGKWYKNCLRPSELLDVNGRHLGFTFLIGRMTQVLVPDIYGAQCSLLRRGFWCKKVEGGQGSLCQHSGQHYKVDQFQTLHI